jgi:hypothetical protein
VRSEVSRGIRTNTSRGLESNGEAFCLDRLAECFANVAVRLIPAQRTLDLVWCIDLQEIRGAGRGSRTPKGRSPADFESAASASSAIPAEGLPIEFTV